VALARSLNYNPSALFSQLSAMADLIDATRLFRGKTVAVKLNLTGDANWWMLGLPPGRTYQVHPNLALATAAFLDHFGAKRIRFVEGTYQTRYTLDQYLLHAGWDLHPLSGLKAAVEFEDTRNLGEGTSYRTVKVPGGGSLFPAYELNHSYVDCDVFVSLAKLKNHITAGVTLGMKNVFGITPTALYSHHAHDENATSSRGAIIHSAAERPADGVPQELHPTAPHLESYRVPRCIVDLVASRPIDLTIIDGIETVSGGEGPWCEDTALQNPQVLIMGRNPVSTDAVAMAVMGYRPKAPRATGPFPGDNHLALAAAHGLGTIDLGQIQVVGLPLWQAIHPFHWEPDFRNT